MPGAHGVGTLLYRSNPFESVRETEGKPLVNPAFRTPDSGKSPRSQGEAGFDASAGAGSRSLRLDEDPLDVVMGVADLPPVLVLGMLYFQKPMSLATLRKVVMERIIELPRFGAVPAGEPGKETFQTLPPDQIDGAYHVSQVEQSAAWSNADLDAFVSSFSKSENKLDPAKPL